MDGPFRAWEESSRVGMIPLLRPRKSPLMSGKGPLKPAMGPLRCWIGLGCSSSLSGIMGQSNLELGPLTSQYPSDESFQTFFG